MKKNIKILIIFCILLAVFYLIYTLFFAKKPEQYFTTNPTKGDLVNSVIANGEILPRDLVNVGTQVGGQIKTIYVKLGDKVKKGDFIAQIDSIKQENEIAKLKAQMQILLADLNANEISLKIAQNKYQREKKLFSSKATSQENLENAKNDLALKNATNLQIKAQIDKNKIDLNTAKTNLSYTKILSPLDGTIISIPVKEGQTVNVNQSTPTIVQVADLSKLEINLQIAEGDLPKIKKGLEVRYSILENVNKKRIAYISSIDPATIAFSDGTYLNNKNIKNSMENAVYFYAKILINNEDNFLKVGMSSQNEIILSESKNTIYIPKNLILKDENGFFVKVLKNEKVQEKAVKLGISNDFYQEIIQGLKEDDELILNAKNHEKSSKKAKKATRL